jgi:hypothetical protein
VQDVAELTACTIRNRGWLAQRFVLTLLRLPRPFDFAQGRLFAVFKGWIRRKSALGAVGPIYFDVFNTAVFLSSLAMMR